MPWVVSAPLGFVVGFVIVFLHPSTKSKGFFSKIGIGFIAGFGACVMIDGVIEVLGYAMAE